MKRCFRKISCKNGIGVAFVWCLVFVMAPPVAQLQEAKLELESNHNQSGIHLQIYYVLGPGSGSDSVSPPTAPSLSAILLNDEERVKGLQSTLENNIRADSGLFKTKSWSSTKDLSIPLNPGLSIGTGNYYVRIGLGSPVKYYSVIMDTGSSLSWIQCEPCKVYCHKQVDPVFDPSSSTTYRSISCGAPQCSSLTEATLNAPECSASNVCLYLASYGDKSYSIGYLSQDILSLTQSQTLPSFVYGCGQDNRGLFGRAAGLLGLARNKLSMLSQVSSKYGYAFSYCLPSPNGGGGFLKIGSSSTAPSKFKFTPMIKGQSSLYFLRLSSITVGGSPLKVGASEYAVPTIIDSGTVITRLPMSVYSALRDAFIKIMSKKYQQAPEGYSILDTCFKLGEGEGTISPSVVPQIEMMFQGGATLTLLASNVLIDTDAGATCLAFAGSTSQMAIIGNLQQQTFEVAYDVANSRIGFAPTACR